MNKNGCICITVTTITGVIAIIILVLYLTLGSGDIGGNNVTIDDNEKGDRGSNGNNNIARKTIQGGFHLYECSGNINIEWKALLTLGLAMAVILATKWSVQYGLSEMLQKKKKKGHQNSLTMG